MGSAGTAVVTLTEALLWTDGRYFNQASKELSSEWTLMRAGQPGVPTINQWLAKNIPSGKCVGVDAFLISAAGAQELEKDLSSGGVTLVSVGMCSFDLSPQHVLSR